MQLDIGKTYQFAASEGYSQNALTYLLARVCADGSKLCEMFGLCASLGTGSQLTMDIMQQTNDIVRTAIVAVRIERNPLTMGQLYDALRKRRNARDYLMPNWEREAWKRMHYTEMPLVEKINVIECQRLKLSQSGFITYL